MKVLRSEIEAHRTERGGFTRETLRLWGVPWPPPKGWKKALEAGKPLGTPDRREEAGEGIEET